MVYLNFVLAMASSTAKTKFRHLPICSIERASLPLL